eukprot:Skav217391  [mRNA]  locus=scaffold532:228486:228701:- [translate_table: standard]
MLVAVVMVVSDAGGNRCTDLRSFPPVASAVDTARWFREQLPALPAPLRCEGRCALHASWSAVECLGLLGMW